MSVTETQLPDPASTHATCAWCRAQFTTIVDLLDHVYAGHTAPRHPVAA